MRIRRYALLMVVGGWMAIFAAASTVLAEEPSSATKPADGAAAPDAEATSTKKEAPSAAALEKEGDGIVPREADAVPIPTGPEKSPLQKFWYNFTHNLFKPLLLFFAMGFLVPILKVQLEFPYTVYQALVIYLLLAIGWKGGEELAHLETHVLGPVLGFMLTGFVTNFFVGIIAYWLLSLLTRMRKIDKATVAGYYGSDSAGTFAICQGVLTISLIKFDAYMPVMLAVMEIPGCLVALYLVSKLRHNGMDPLGNMPGEPGYNPRAIPSARIGAHGHHDHELEEVRKLSLENAPDDEIPVKQLKKKSILSKQLLHEVFLNSGLYLLFGGITIGFISGLQGGKVTKDDDLLFVDLFQGILCLFLLEMGMTASRKLKDLKAAGLGYIIFGLVAPNLFAPLGIVIAHTYSMLTGTHFQPGTYVLFAVLCGAASYIAVPAVQRLAIPEASPTLPLAASLGLTFSWNVTVGIPIYIEIASAIQRIWPAA